MEESTMKVSKLVTAMSIAVVLTAVVWAAQTVSVNMNGRPSSGRMINGAVYVKLADVAAAFDMQVAGKGSAYSLVKPGGANQLQGVNGKLGQELFTGKWKFLVKDVQRVDKYMLKYSDSKFELTAEPGMDLVIVNCRFKNGVRESAYIYFNGMGNTALTDMEEHAYKIKWGDIGGGVADTLLPGSAKDFALVFAVPEGAELKDLVYTIEPVDVKKFGITDLRISLK
jgi:hypothetical protein